MTEDSKENKSISSESVSSSSASSSSSSSSSLKAKVKEQNWKLPNGIEDHLESGVIKVAIGAAVGGIVGMALFRSGKGWRSASVAMGTGVAIGSTVERAIGLKNVNK
mmetsp:Transcript_533/g.868  ORF Transcript_533/g.868 Transcript_533/m.868 type:complete len:107 (-) Transcript_533:348-668(-)|eukprot:CAMPEP_0184859720 /NCGR_PEP_ID=MMETSP0580-20130426/4709_1 /TAXON_ID=1118495 /ORGANISM="Dactyliosolen fragilissimus" /LENGTH=106 /DNA_ID=CAMNT_0027356515 /DNA_START=195 /DNA_END=515 /DNA_ORIENTATION=-